MVPKVQGERAIYRGINVDIEELRRVQATSTAMNVATANTVMTQPAAVHEMTTRSKNKGRSSSQSTTGSTSTVATAVATAATKARAKPSITPVKKAKAKEKLQGTSAAAGPAYKPDQPKISSFFHRDHSRSLWPHSLVVGELPPTNGLTPQIIDLVQYRMMAVPTVPQV
ncbi:hypothetical protein FA10DRAFT_288068 [Acaromyces ingoldii]|uniref:Uncharacterized protein n=1 Tax=Acaromyces ingoldii TaxID=215250 RepID=A0A316YG74_9BASI|nr:hypothetical protein FA10DRAFT_288068 [Acaromyces ingoldii]PWN88530.1 hypothetical protein FA10DRAFT_288068 [Acaromyces ingoldii]